MRTRTVPLTREVYIEQEDFMEDAPKKFFRLKPGGEVRLRFAGIIKCDEVVKDAAGRVTELRCTFDPDHSRKVKGTIHWVSAPHALTAEVRLYDHLFKVENPDDAPPGGTFLDNLNPSSLEVIKDAQSGAVARRSRARFTIPVRARRLLFCRRHRLKAGQTGI